ncbi:MAG: hypothetical protein MUF21_10335, partial [Gemmatimonadaceae bacterium]|nr:hypothetical protein [Gemmatimonadaceae bacterium]
SRIRGAIRGETRVDDNGAPVVWELVMFGPDSYRWRDTTWSEGRYTGAITRCPDQRDDDDDDDAPAADVPTRR